MRFLLFSSKNPYLPHHFLLRAGAVLLCLLFFTGCSDFADIFRKQGKVYRKPSSHEKGRQVASKKNRKGNGQVVHGFFIWPVDGEISSGFGMRNGHAHDGIDIRAPKDSPVHASAAGEVVYSGRMSSYGNLILIRHRDNYFTAYAHNDENLVEEGKKVEQGDLIAKVGDTGNATGYHVHFEVRDGSTPMDPMLFLPDANGPVLVRKTDLEEKPMEGGPPIEAHPAESGSPPAESESPNDPTVLY